MTDKKIRCAIYTRKSSEEGLEQEFNSLDAQYEASLAFISSQKHEGWKRVSKRYDDGGISGGTLKRPALQELLNDIEAGLIDMIVIYKIDRLTRSLADFAKIVEKLDKTGASFVSVTQSFNTATSMGRLTLNMLLSFAQFEREVTAERIRDKIAASKKRGLWMGGNVALGYQKHPDSNQRMLVIDETEAKTINRLFQLYDQHGGLAKVETAANEEGLRSKGGIVMSRGQIHKILTNPLYIGKICHKERIYDGQHEAIIEQALWEAVQTKLQLASTKKRGQLVTEKNPSWLTGKLVDDQGDRMTPTHTRKEGRIIRYYISQRLVAKGKDPSAWRLPARSLEATIYNLILEHFKTSMAQHKVLQEIDIHQQQMALQSLRAFTLELQADHLDTKARLQKLIQQGKIERGQFSLTFNAITLAEQIGCKTEALHPDLLGLTAPFVLRRRGVEIKIIAGEINPEPDQKLQTLLVRAHQWAEAVRKGCAMTAVAKTEKTSESFIRNRIKLAFLSPAIQKAIMEGNHPPQYSIEYFIRHNTIPLDWQEQEIKFGLNPPAPK